MKRTYFAGIIALALCLTLASCGANHAPTEETDFIDNNTYSSSPGMMCYNEDAIYYYDLSAKRLSFMSRDLSAPLSPLCARPDCKHNNTDCSSYVDCFGVYAWKDHLYYIDSSDNTFALCQMDKDGQNRTELTKLGIDRENEIYYLYQIAAGHLLFHMYEGDNNNPVVTSYLYSLENPKADPVILNCSSWTEDQWIITIPYLFEDCIFFNLSNRDSSFLNMYDISSGKTERLLDQWHPLDALSYSGDTLYFFDQSEGSLNSLDLNSKEITRYRNDLPVDAIPYGNYDDCFFYLNATDEEVTPLSEQFFIIYDLEGNELQRMALKDSGLEYPPTYSLSTSKYVIIKSMVPINGVYSERPQCYIEKEAIREGNAAFIPIK